MESGVRSVCFRGDFTIKTVVVFMRNDSLEKCITRCEAFLFIYAIFLVADFTCWSLGATARS